MKYCPKCNKEYAGGNFCETCENPDGSPVRLLEKVEQPAMNNSGLNVGGKVVTGGDFNSTVNNVQNTTDNSVHNNQTYHNEQINNTTTNISNTTNTTNITYKDDTKETCICSICGKHTLKIHGYTCTECNKFVCKNDYNDKYKICKKCSGEHESAHGKFSSLKMLQEEIQRLESDRDVVSDFASNAFAPLLGGLNTVDDQIAVLIENYIVPDTADGKIAFLNFVKIKTCKPVSITSLYASAGNARGNPAKKAKVVSALKAKAEEVYDTLEYSDLSKEEIVNVKKAYRIYKEASKKRRKTILIIVGAIVLFYIILFFGEDIWDFFYYLF